MADERREILTDPAALEALGHPVRLDVMNHLMSSGPATASACARAVGDTASNCSYHLRVLERVGLVESVESADGRERPWRTRLTGFSTEGGAASDTVLLTSIQLHQRKLHEFLNRRSQAAPEWVDAATVWHFALRISPGELQALSEQVDALVRPFLAATRTDAPADAVVVGGEFTAFPEDDVSVPAGTPRPERT